MNRGCGMHGMPSVYARVNSFYDWFHSVVNQTLNIPRGPKTRCMEGVTKHGESTDGIGGFEDWIHWSRGELELINDWALNLQQEIGSYADVSELANMYRPLFLETVREQLKQRDVGDVNLFCEIEKKKQSHLDWANFPHIWPQHDDFFC